MATIKVACPKCGQKVSGDESFHGSVVECPICSSDIHFPGSHRHERGEEKARPEERRSKGDSSLPTADHDEANKPVRERRGEEPVRLEDKRDPEPKLPEKPAGEAPAEGRNTEAGDNPVETFRELPPVPPSPIYGAISIVSAVLSVVTCIGGVLFAPIAIIFGHTALAKARHSPVHPAPGQTLGAIGLMIGYVSLVITILVLLALVFFGDTIREGFQRVME